MVRGTGAPPHWAYNEVVGRDWESLSVVGKLLSGATAVVGFLCLVSLAFWYTAGHGAWNLSGGDIVPWNRIGFVTGAAAVANLVLAGGVAWRYDRGRGMFGMVSSIVTVLCLVSAGGFKT